MLRAVAIVAGLLSAMHCETALAGDAEDCKNKRISPDTAFAACHRLAEQGQSWAQLELAYYYQFGDGPVEKDEQEAVRWYRRAAEQGLWEGQFNLALMCLMGKGVALDKIQGLKWLTIAAAATSGAKRDGIMRTRNMAAQDMTSRGNRRSGEDGPRMEAETRIAIRLWR